MPSIEIDQKTYEALQRQSVNLKRDIPEVIAHLAGEKLTSRQWMPQDKWESLKGGENCPLCEVFTLDEGINQYGYTVADLNISRLRLARNQYVRGYCVLVCRVHGPEPHHMTSPERNLFFEDMTRVGEALEQVYAPTKLNFELLGNAVPHIHAHIVPRYYGDAFPAMPINPELERIELTHDEYTAEVVKIQAALGL